MIDVSVVVACYYPDWGQLQQTINSILNQEGVSVEIIIADDGSSDNLFSTIETYFRSCSFSDYKLVSHPENVGTCRNVYDGLLVAEGAYAKLISPGDYLFEKNTLKNWIAFMKERQSDYSFGTYVNYHLDSAGKVLQERERLRPYSISYFLKRDYRNAAGSYLVMSDAPNGASFLGNRAVMTECIGRITGHVRYAEDFSVRLFLLDGGKLDFFDCPVIWYENGTGISTGKAERWKKLLEQDLKSLNRLIIHDYHEKKGFAGRFSKYLVKCENADQSGSLSKYLYFPQSVFWRLSARVSERYTVTGIDSEAMTDIIREPNM